MELHKNKLATHKFDCILCDRSYIKKSRLRIHDLKYVSKKFHIQLATAKILLLQWYDGSIDQITICMSVCFQRVSQKYCVNTKTESCPFCSATFEHKFHLKQHIKRRHDAEMPTGLRDNVDMEQMN